MPIIYRKKLVQLFLLLVATQFLSSKCQNPTYQQFINSTPTTFGLLTVTHIRNNSYKYFHRYLQRYATMQCKQMTEISIVWNNNISFEQTNMTITKQWKRPVYFYKTEYNSMDFRYRLPKQSQAQVFFSLDDDIVIPCNELLRSFQIWRSYAIGDIGPLVGYAPRSFSFSAKTQIFQYGDPRSSRFFSLSLIGVAWVSKFYLDLYNNLNIWEIVKIRQIVQKINNCDDIAMNYLVRYFFPQFPPMVLKGKLSFQMNPSSQSFVKSHYLFRTQCLKSFSLILGYNPLIFVDRNHKQNSERYKSSVKKINVFLKKKQLVALYFRNQGKNKEEITLELNSGEDEINKYFCQGNQNSKDQPTLIIENQKKCSEDNERINKELSAVVQSNNKLAQQLQQYQQKQQQQLPQQQIPQQQLQQQEQQKPQRLEQQQLQQQQKQIATNSIFYLLRLRFALGYLFSICCLKGKGYQNKPTNFLVKTQQKLRKQEQNVKITKLEEKEEEEEEEEEDEENQDN